MTPKAMIQLTLRGALAMAVRSSKRLTACSAPGAAGPARSARPDDGNGRMLRPQMLSQSSVDLFRSHLLQHVHVLEQRRVLEMVKQEAVGDELQRIEQLHELAHRLTLYAAHVLLGQAFGPQSLQSVEQ